MLINEKAEVVYLDVDEKFVGAVVLYPDMDKTLWYDLDSETTTILPDDLFNLAIKGLVRIYKDGQYLTPTQVIHPEDSGDNYTKVSVAFGGSMVDFNSAPYPIEE